VRAFSLIRSQPWYRSEAFHSGLRKAGYQVISGRVEPAKPGDILLIWNRYGVVHEQALRFEQQGGTVLVAENGYLNADGSSPKFSVHPHGPKPTDYYAVGLGFHNDHTRVLPGSRKLGVELKPWRADGEHILICPNRSFGVPDRMMPPDWAEKAQKRLQSLTRRPLRVRAHPGNNAPQRPLKEDLKGAWAVVVWSSSVAVHALVEGVPAFIEAPHQIIKPASASGSPDEPVCPERLPHFEKLACGQYTCEEISLGVPFKLLSAAK
jgi:hypothetical protein